MADVTRASVSLCSGDVPPHCQMTLPAATALTAGDMVYINSSGKFAKCDGTNLDALSDWWGMINRDVAAADVPITAYHSVQFNYSTGLTPGAKLYLDNGTAGGLDTAATTGGNTCCAYVVDAKTIFVLPPRTRA